MNPTTLFISIVRAKDYIEKAERAKKKYEENGGIIKTGCKITAACRRSSMELTRSLAQMRKPG